MTYMDYLEEISNYIFTGRYSRYNEDLKRRETWEEAIERLEAMHLKKYSFLNEEDLKKIKWAFSLVKNKRVVPSMRSIQFGGKAIEAKNERIYNCAVRHVDSLRSFSEIFYLLLCGCGVGIGVSKHFLNRLPDLVNENDKTGTVITYSIHDSIEGWADSVEALLNCYFKNTPYTGRKIVFDYSKIRKKGEILKTSGGKAPGYKGLKNCHERIKSLLDHCIEYRKQNRLRPIDSYDILMHSADAVLSGGIRRSATSVIFDKDDEEMLNSKTFQKVEKVYSFHHSHTETIGGNSVEILEGKVMVEGKKYEVFIKNYELESLQKNHLINWSHLYPQRARSNNSVLLLRDTVTEAEFESFVERTKQFGEPGFVFANHPYQLMNPCFEINFIPVTADGVCGVQFCNLTSINGRLVTSREAFAESVEAYTIIGTLQAGYTNFPYLSNAAKQLTEEEALLGCSITGMMDNPNITLNPKIQKEMAELAVKTNEEWSTKIKINQAARITCIKPEGTCSLILGSGSGIHPHHARKYIRRVQNNTLDNVYKYFKKQNPHMCEPSVWSANKTDDIISFPVEVSENAMIKRDLSAIQHLELIKSTQQNWVLPGVTKSNKKNIQHSISCTVIVKQNEWSDVLKYLYKNKKYFSAVSLLSETGDKDFLQSPMEAVINNKDENYWKQLVEKFKSVDYKELKELDDKTNLSAEGSCYGGVCQII